MFGNTLLSRSILYAIFFLSGATGLVYQVIWVRLTGLVFGNTSHAIAVVLGAFMAGLALGSWRLGRAADRTVAPLRLYGILEVGIGLSAATVPFVFRALDSVYWALAPSLDQIPGGSGLARFLTSFVVLLVPTFLMGGTLPALTRFFTHSLNEVERKVGILYALNTFGAAAGTLAAALVLIPYLGNTTTALTIATINLGIGGIAIWLSSLGRETGAGPAALEEATVTSVSGEELPNPVANRLVLLTLAISGFAAMLYEVAWTRALAAIIGSSTYAFSIMLVTFLVGIALGSSIVSRRRPAAGVRLLGLMQLGVAVGGFVFLAGYLAAPYALIALVRAFFYSFPAVLTTQFVVCAGLMILATLFMGATFPVASQLYSSKFTILGRSIGNVYSVNTLGAIAGSLLAGFALIPLVGTERTILIGLFFNSAIALVLLTQDAERACRKNSGLKAAITAAMPRYMALALLLVATISMRGGFFWDPDSLDRGILIYSRQFDARPELKIDEHYEDTDVVYFKEGNNASISVRKGEGYLGLRTNGKVDASNRDDMQTQLTAGWLPGFYHPNPKSALVIGYGSGVTVGAVTVFPEIEEIDCVEIESAVVGAAPWFSEINRKSYEHPKVNIIFDDARNHMNVTRKQYDVIISEPSNPWIAGVASLFTAEFYDRAVEVLKPGGVFVQWVQLYELDPEDLRMILKEFQRKFPEVSAWVTGSDLLLVGTQEPQRLDVNRIARIARSDPGMMRDFRDYLHMTRAEGFLAYYVMSTEEVRKLAETERRNTDDHPLLEFHAPRRLFSDTRDLNIDLLYEAKPGLVPPDADLGDPELTYLAMIEPLLAMKRDNLANQAMALLAQTLRKEEGSLHLALARLNIESDAFTKAEVSLKTADSSVLPESPLFAEKEELWGVLYDSLGSDGDAKFHFQRAVESEPMRGLSLRKLAEIDARAEVWADAAKWMERYIRTEPQSAGHYWAMLGDYYLAAERVDEAVKALQTALEVDPYVYWGRYRMARVFEQQKDVANAIEQYEFIVRYAFDRNAEIYVKLATLYKDAGRLNDARRILKKGHRIFPANVSIYRLYQEVFGA